MAGRRARRHVVSQVKATLLVHGPRQLLRAVRKRVIEGFNAEGDGLRLSQSHREDQLEFTIESTRGLPYPVLVAASARHPDCVLTVQWESDGACGVTSIRNGEVESTDAAAAGNALAESIEVDAAGALHLGLALASAPAGAHQPITGYAATRTAETYFRVSGGAQACTLQTTGGDGRVWNEDWHLDAAETWTCGASATPQPISTHDIRALDDAAAGFRARWLWYRHAPLEVTAIERQRAHDAARPLNPINVQSRGLARLAAGHSGRIAPQSQWLVALLKRAWAAADI